MSDLEKICTTERTKGTISTLYKILLKIGERSIPPFIEKWERELGSQRDKATIERMLTLTHSSAVDSRTAEMSFKCIAGWYMTPDKLKFFNEEQTGLLEGLRITRKYGSPLVGMPKDKKVLGKHTGLCGRDYNEKDKDRPMGCPIPWGRRRYKKV